MTLSVGFSITVSLLILLPKLRGSDSYPGGTVSHRTRQPLLDAHRRFLGSPIQRLLRRRRAHVLTLLPVRRVIQRPRRASRALSALALLCEHSATQHDITGNNKFSLRIDHACAIFRGHLSHTDPAGRVDKARGFQRRALGCVPVQGTQSTCSAGCRRVGPGNYYI
jgi:hypothetical protein